MGTLPVLDQYGHAALCCGADGSALIPASEGSPVLMCPRCGHRTDAPGAGVLGDGFDVIHRQWGLRGDPHAWRTLRDLLGATPTPVTPEAVRAAYVEGLSQLIGADLDSSGDHQVYCDDLDHGGMSGGVVDLDWWRTKGVPLLVDRAIDRRPPVPHGAAPDNITNSSPTRGLRAAVVGIMAWLVILAIPATLLGSGGWLLYQRGYGTRVRATVLSCDAIDEFRRVGRHLPTDCVAEWVIDGQTVVGGFDGGNGPSDIGKTVDVTVRGNTAYSRSLVLPALLIALGLPFLVIPLAALRRAMKRRRGHPR